eukprot:6163648-Amphidinium_carterae.4
MKVNVSKRGKGERVWSGVLRMVVEVDGDDTPQRRRRCETWKDGDNRTCWWIAKADLVARSRAANSARGDAFALVSLAR